MYADSLKEQINGVTGSFIIRSSRIVESDLTSEQQSRMQNISCLIDIIAERKNPKRMIYFGQDKYLSIHFYGDLIIGVILTHATNVFLLDIILRHILKPEHIEVSETFPATLEQKVPYFDRSKENILPNVPQYARQVLEFVDGKRTVEDIIAKSNLPPEVVLDIILAYRRSSVLHYRE